MKLHALIIMAALFSPILVRAQERAVIIDRGVLCPFTPVSADFLLELPGYALIVPAQVIVPGTKGQKFHVGTAVELPEELSTLQYSLILRGDGGSIKFVPPHILPLSAVRKRTLEGLRERLAQRKKLLESWRVQERVQHDSLERLREDAEVIGNLGRIAEKAEELKRVRLEIAGTEKDIQNLQRFLKLASKSAEPQNFVKRRAILNQQLEELVKQARAMEAGERERKVTGETKLQRELRLVEETRTDDYDVLRDELSRLRESRKILEEKYMELSRSDEYQPVQ